MADRLQVGVPTVRDILDALARPGRDPREDLPPPIFKKGILKLEDLQPGMELKGTVLNVVDFGAFIDIGLKDSGLVHISQMANRYVKSPYDVVAVGDVVNVWVLAVDKERHRVSLTMIQPGTERKPPERRPPPPRRDQREQREQGQGGGQPHGHGPVARPGQPAGPPRVVEARPAQGGGGPREGGRSREEAEAIDRGRRRAGRTRSGLAAARHHATGRRRQQAAPAAPSRGPRAEPGWRASTADRGPGRRNAAGGKQPAAPPRKAKRPPPPRLSQAALSGKEPLSTFGELAALFEAQTEPPAPAVVPPPPPPEPSQEPPAQQPIDGQTPPPA